MERLNNNPARFESAFAMTREGNRCGFDIRRKPQEYCRRDVRLPFDIGFGSGPVRGRESSAEMIKLVVDQFTTLLSNAFKVIEQSVQALFTQLEKQEQAAEAPAAATQAPQTETPAAETAAPAEETAGPAEAEPNEDKGPKESKLDKKGEFLWKPVSDKDGKLAILLPGRMTGKVKNVKILGPNGEVLSKGKYSGTGNPANGKEREHYRFEKAGSGYPDGAVVQITLKNGNIKTVKIKESSARTVH